MPKKFPCVIFVCEAEAQLIPAHYNLPCSGYLAVKILTIEYHIDIESLFAAAEFEIVWHPPRVPAGSVSPEGHYALGDLLAVGSRNENSWANLFII